MVAIRIFAVKLALLALSSAFAQTAVGLGSDWPPLSQEYLERTGPPFGFLSVQHFYAILKRCESVDPAAESVQSRREAFEQLLDAGKTTSGLWRTFFDPEGQPKETRHPNARAMFTSPEFAQDIKRYDATVAAVPRHIQVQDCGQFEALVAQALNRR
jgi:hypothetical protein